VVVEEETMEVNTVSLMMVDAGINQVSRYLIVGLLVGLQSCEFIILREFDPSPNRGFAYGIKE
jgi:hypothetical protein